MNSDERARHVDALTAWIAKDEAFADELALLAADLRRSGREQLADALLVCSRNFRVTALDLRGQLAAAKPFNSGNEGGGS